MPVFLLNFLLELGLVVHILKTGRNRYWIYLVLFAPLIGMLAYFIVELLPELSNSRTGKKVQQNTINLINPNCHLTKATESLDIADTIENRSMLANEYMQRGNYQEADALYNKCLTGMYKEDPYFMRCSATSKYYLGRYSEAKQLLDNLIEKNPTYKDPDGHLIYARTLQALGETKQALEEYEVLKSYYSGPQAVVHYALFLEKLNRRSEAIALLETVELNAKRSKSYRTINIDWIHTAKLECRRMQSI